MSLPENSFLAAVPRWLDPIIWAALRARVDETDNAAWNALHQNLVAISPTRWQLPTRDEALAAARTANPAQLQRWHLAAFRVFAEHRDFGEAVYHFEQAGNLCLSRLAYDELADWLAETPDNLLDLARFSHLKTYFSAVLAVEKHEWTQANALLDALVSAQNLDADLAARVANTRGVQAYRQARYDVSLRYYASAREQFARLGDGVGQLRAQINIAVVQNQLGQIDDAILVLQEALTLANKLREPVWESWILNELGINFKDRGEWHVALDYFERALASARALNRTRGAVTALANLGELYLLLGKLTEAERAYESVLQSDGPAFAIIEALGHMGLLCQLQQRHTDARRYFRDALTRAESIGSVSYQALSHFRLGMLAWRENDLEQARFSFESAIHFVETLRGQIEAEDVRIQLFGGWQQVYNALFLVSLAEGNTRAALTWSERARARAFLDLLTTRGAKLELGEPLDAAAIQVQLPVGAVLLSYFNTNAPAQFQAILDRLATYNQPLCELLLPPDQCVLLIVTRELVDAHVLPMTGAALMRRAFAADGRVLSGLTPNSDGLLGTPWVLPLLGQALLAPAVAQLRDAPRVIVVPHGPLHYVPFTALQYLDGSNCFSDNCSVLLAPSATVLLAHCRRPNPPASENGLVFGFAPDLEHAELEARTVAAQLNGALCLGQNATQVTFFAQANRARIVHFSCHGSFDAVTPLDSGLQLADGVLTAASLLNQLPFLRCDLVTLSACESGRSGVLGGDELLGLVRAFLYAGTPSALVSLWAVDELSTRVLMRLFYEALLREGDKAMALRLAQRALINMTLADLATFLAADGATETEIQFNLTRLEVLSSALPTNNNNPLAHPYFWAGFVLIGDDVRDFNLTAA